MSELPDLFPGFKRHSVDVNGVTIHARSSGKGPPLLCLHGYPQTHACWHKVAPRLAETNTVVAMISGATARVPCPGAAMTILPIPSARWRQTPFR